MEKIHLATFFQKAELSLGLEYLFHGVEQIVGSYHDVRSVKIALEKNLNETFDCVLSFRSEIEFYKFVFFLLEFKFKFRSFTTLSLLN